MTKKNRVHKYVLVHVSLNQCLYESCALLVSTCHRALLRDETRRGKV